MRHAPALMLAFAFLIPGGGSDVGNGFSAGRAKSPAGPYIANSNKGRVGNGFVLPSGGDSVGDGFVWQGLGDSAGNG